MLDSAVDHCTTESRVRERSGARATEIAYNSKRSELMLGRSTKNTYNQLALSMTTTKGPCVVCHVRLLAPELVAPESTIMPPWQNAACRHGRAHNRLWAPFPAPRRPKSPTDNRCPWVSDAFRRRAPPPKKNHAHKPLVAPFGVVRNET